MVAHVTQSIDDLGDKDIKIQNKNPEGCHTGVGTVVGLQYKPGDKQSVAFCNQDALKGGNCCSDWDEYQIRFKWMQAREQILDYYESLFYTYKFVVALIHDF